MENIKLYYYDINSRVYNLNGVKKNSPYEIGYYREINVVSENDNEYICEYGVVKKKDMKYVIGKSKYNTYTESEVTDMVFIAENRHLIAEKVRYIKSAELLRKIEKLINN